MDLLSKKLSRRVSELIAYSRYKLSETAVGYPMALAVWLILAGIILAQFGFAPMSGDLVAHRYWLSAAFQGIAALFALFISAALIMAQLASQAYTHRQTQSFFRAPWFWVNVLFGLSLLVYLLYVQTILNEKSPEPFALIWIAFLLSVVYLLLVPVSMSGALNAVRPINIVIPILRRVDEELLALMTRRGGDRRFEPLPLDDNPLLEIESVTAAFLRQREFGLAGATLHDFIEALACLAKPQHYEPLCWHVGHSIEQIAKVLIELQNDELLRELVSSVANLHQRTFNAEFAGDHAYTDTSWPKVLIDIGRECVRADFPKGAQWCEIGLGWMIVADLKKLPPESKNTWFQSMMRRDRVAGQQVHTEEERRIKTQFDNVNRLYIDSLSSIAENPRSAAEVVIRDVINAYRHLFFTLRDELKQDHVLTRQNALRGISYELGKLIRLVGRFNAWEVLASFDFGWLSDFCLRGGDVKVAPAFLRVECDAVLRAVEGGVNCGTLHGVISDIACMGCLSSLDQLPDGLEMVKVSVETLCKLAEIIPAQYAGHGLGEDYDGVYEELGSRLLQIKRSGQAKNPLPQEFVAKIEAVMVQHFPGFKDKYAPAAPASPS